MERGEVPLRGRVEEGLTPMLQRNSNSPEQEIVVHKPILDCEAILGSAHSKA